MRWAEANHTTNGLLLLIDCARLYRLKKFIGIRHLADTLSTPVGSACLTAWTEEIPFCEQINRFSSRFSKDEPIQDKYGPLPTTQSEDSLFKGLKKELYLLRMCRTNLPIKEQSTDEWIQFIHTWLMVHAVIRAIKGNTLDENLYNLSVFLANPENLKAIRILASHTALNFSLDDIPGFSDCDYLISSSANSNIYAGLSGQVAKAMNAMQAIASGDSSRMDIRLSRAGTYWAGLPDPIKTEYAETEDDHSPFEPDWRPIESTYGQEDDDGVGTSKVDANHSYAFQRLSTNTVWMSSSELHHMFPWSWNRPNPVEIPGLSKLIDTWLKSMDPAVKLLASYIWLAIHLGRSLRRVCNIEISQEPSTEWIINPDTGVLYRLPPIRPSSWKTEDDEILRWVRPYADHNEIRPPPTICKILTQAVKTSRNQPASLGDVWLFHAENQNIETLFNQSRPDELSRVTPGMLGNLLEQQLYEATGNANLARLSAFHPKSGLTGSFAYVNYDLELVDRLMHPNEKRPKSIEQSSANVIGMGSRLDPIEEMLIEAIDGASHQLKALRSSNSPIAFFNAYIGYYTTALWAGTGSRPANDSFESPLHFINELNAVYVNDKADYALHGGNLHSVPTQLMDVRRNQLSQLYQYMSQALRDVHPRLAKEIELLANHTPSGKLPYLFLIDEKTLGWSSISEENINKLGLFDWPLPMNLFRQRFIKQAARTGIEQEVINGWMNHGEKGNTTYGDFSIRCWRDDLETYQPIVDDLFSRLGFDTFDIWDSPPVIPKQKHARFKTDIFGISKRKKKRTGRQKKGIQDAKRLIDASLRGRTLEELSEQELDTLTLKLIRRKNKLPHPEAAIRYRQLSDQLEALWQDEGKKVHIRRRIYPLDQDNTRIKQTSSIAHPLFHSLCDQAAALLDKLEVSRTSRATCRLLVVVALAIENRLAYPRMLKDIYRGKHVRITKYRRGFHLEYAEQLKPEDLDAPIERHPLSTKTATLLDRVLSNTHQADITKTTFPKELLPIIETLCSYWPKAFDSHEAFIDQLATITDQANSIDLPGTAAATLSGRVLSCSLGHRDMVRLDRARIIDLPVPENIPADTDIMDVDKMLAAPDIRFRSSIMPVLEDQVLQNHANDYLRQVAKALSRYQKSNPIKTVKALQALSKAFDGKASTTILMLGDWINALIKRGKRNNSDPFADSTPDRYFTELSTTFEQIAYNIDLLAADEEEITLLYNNYLEASKHKKGTYHADRLLSFHAYARRQSVEDPKWEELDLPVKTRMVLPGIITEKDYQSALHLILNLKIFSEELRYMMAFLLLLCYRFGLRSMEALGLTREDWCDEGDILHVLVRSHQKGRQLKSDASRRIVPLLFTLSALEQRIIDTAIAQAEARYPGDMKACLFARGPKKSEINDVDLLKKTVIRILKQVTGNPDIVLHHARHTFVNAITLPLYHIDLPLWGKLMPKSLDTQRLREIALGSNQGIARRNTVAVARLAGHGHPRTTAVSYQHLYGEWIGQLVNVDTKPTDKQLTTALVIDEYPTHTPVTTRLLEARSLDYQRPSMELLIKLLALVSRGKPFSLVGEKLGLDPDHIRQIEETTLKVGSRIRLSTKQGQAPIDGEAFPLEFLARIPGQAWQRIIAQVRELESQLQYQEQPLLSPQVLPETIGLNRQLTLWDEHHFTSLAAMLQDLDIPPSQYRVCQEREDAQTRGLAEAAGFNVLTPIQAGTKGKPLTLDSARGVDKSWHHHARYHCVLAFNRNADFWVRDSLQLLAVYIAYICAVALNNPSV